MREPDEREYYERCVRPLLAGVDCDLSEPGIAERVDLVGRAVGLLNPIDWPEPFGLVMAESLAAGTPVIAAPEGAAPEIVTDGRTGFLRGGEEDAAAAVDRLPEIDRDTCRADAEMRFSLERMAADHERLYQRILDSPRRPVPASYLGRSTAAPGVAAATRVAG
jgi:glycosyltransferase involved in cell wall biosynthesis